MTRVLHYNQTAADTVGTTAGTLETVGTITLGSNTTEFYGMYFQACSTATMTTAEAMQGSWIVNCRSLAPQTLDFLTPRGCGGSPATNEGQLVDNGFFWPWFPTNRNYKNEQITAQFDIEIEATSEYAAQFFTLEAEEPINTAVLRNWGTQPGSLVTPINWAATASDNDIGNATSETFPENITIPAWVECVVAAGISVNDDAVPTAGEHELGYIELSGTYPGLYPMKIPVPSLWPTLGTAAEMSESGKMLIVPMHMPGTGRNETITPTAFIQITKSGVMNWSITLFGYGRPR